MEMVSPFLDWKKKYEMFNGCRCGGSCGLRKVNIQMGEKMERKLLKCDFRM